MTDTATAARQGTAKARQARARKAMPEDQEAPETPNGQAGDERPATNPRKELVREQLIDIAAELFDRKGYLQTNISDIALAMGLGRSAIYHYFRNKEEILAALVESEALTPSHRLQELMAQTDLSETERLRRAVVDGIVRRLSSGSRFILLSRLETQIPGELGPLYHRGRRAIYNFYVQCLTEGMARGEFRQTDPKIAAFAVIGMANWTSRWYSPNGSKSPRQIAEIIADFAIQALRADSEGIDRHTGRAAIGRMRDELAELERILL